MTDSVVRVIDHLTIEEIVPLLETSLAEGYDLVHRLWQEYESGENRFDSNGAALFGVDGGDSLIAVGGVQLDPYLNQQDAGRVRHVYVHPAWRRAGIGRMLISALIDHSVAHFDVLTLRTPTDHGDKFYTSLGFQQEPRYDSVTHWLSLEEIRLARQGGGR